jgi:hypothetical protein
MLSQLANMKQTKFCIDRPMWEQPPSAVRSGETRPIFSRQRFNHRSETSPPYAI